MNLLALDSATDLCSAALWLDGRLLGREQLAPRAHGRLLLPMVQELLAEAALKLPQLDAIAFGRGPGAFTGLRLAAAVAQGLGFALDRPLIGISDLEALALRALESVPGTLNRVLVCQDARMEEVYWGRFERSAAGVQAASPERVSPPGAVTLPPDWECTPLCAVGSGFEAYAPLRERLARRAPEATVVLLPELLPRAREIALLAARQGLATAVSPEQALPVYLRDQVTRAPAKLTEL